MGSKEGRREGGCESGLRWDGVDRGEAGEGRIASVGELHSLRVDVGVVNVHDHFSALWH